MMVGLPDSTWIDEMNTAKELAKLKPKIIRIYPVLVIKRTELERQLKGASERVEIRVVETKNFENIPIEETNQSNVTGGR